ncbi:MAG: nickel pincer cofactor biosynthesis protein LarB [Lachnospiraceae bacterium]|nr:nickel pincer cofactor biosynthesis protein LarB [Lachnospiraceae bacterium]
MNTDLYKILEDVRDKKISVKEAELLIKKEPYADIDFAKIDLQRKDRQGVGEVIYGAGKTPERIIAIVKRMQESSDDGILITRLSKEKAEIVSKELDDLFYHEESMIGIVGEKRKADGTGTVVVVTGGTSDIPVAEEAALTAEFLGNKVDRIYDVGVAGIHRLFSAMDRLMDASVIIAIAGMEGALASVVGGLVSAPVIAVPTSVGYGASFEGLSALLSMLNSCAAGVSVVNIDNGFGAGFYASLINHMGESK